MLARIAIGLFAISVSAVAVAAPCAGFVDVDDSNATYCSAVAYVKNKGISLGCTDASHYCPGDYVNRLQMALFLQRAGKGNAANVLVDATATIGGGGASGTTFSSPTYGATPCSFPAGGPCANAVTDMFGTVAGGAGNRAGDATGAIDSASLATVGGGLGNTASGSLSTVAGGLFNVASAYAATVPGGFENTALGEASFAAGKFAIAGGDGSFAWADGSGWIFDPSNGPGGWGSNRANTFSVRATGGVWFLTGVDSLTGHPTVGAGVEVLPGNGAWTTYSDRNGKDDIEAVDPDTVLKKLVATPVATWRWKGEDARFRHMGPMAQDFYAAFHLGADDRHIVTVDAEGVALAAIQGLNAKLETRLAEKDKQLEDQQREIAELRERVAQVESLRGELAALRNAIAATTRGAAIAAQVDITAP